MVELDHLSRINRFLVIRYFFFPHSIEKPGGE
jgi:hypothetical protein